MSNFVDKMNTWKNLKYVYFDNLTSVIQSLFFPLFETNLYYEALDVCFSKCKCFSMGYRPHDDECELTDALLFIASKPSTLLL